MYKSLIIKSLHLFEDKVFVKRFVVLSGRQMCGNSQQNHRFNEFISIISSEKLKAKQYIVIEDKCNSLAKLNTRTISHLLETNVKQVFKWVYNHNNCALIVLNDGNYKPKRSVIKSLGSHKSLTTNSRVITINSCPKVLNDRSLNEGTDDTIYQMTSRRKDGYHLNVKYLRQCFNTNEELISVLLDNKYFNDLDLMLRFYIISQLEQNICQSMFKDFQLLPFGSSIAGLGTPNSDLDLVLMPRMMSKVMVKSNRHEERNRLKSSLSLIADVLQSSTQFYSHFSRVLTARIPIIKFGYDLAPIDIDLSVMMSSYSIHHGVVMSAFLNYCTQLNPCVRDLILLLRIWAKEHNILKPKNWSTTLVYNGFTSFQLTALVIYFLQKQTIVPPMNHFLDNSNHPFIPFKCPFDSIQLLGQFFDFVVSLRLDWEAISILEANTFPNPDSSPIYMQNPFEIELNMCRNITSYKLEKFLELSQISSEIMKVKDFHLVDIFDREPERPLNSNCSRIKVEDLFSD